MIEYRLATPQPLPRFEEYFYKYDKSFSQAADAWTNDRRVLLPFKDETFFRQIIPWVIAAVSSFDDSILSDRIDYLSTHFARANRIICWSQGIPDIQADKVACVKGRLIDRGVNPNSIGKDLIGEVKMEKVNEILSQVISLSKMKTKERNTSFPMVIVEDKISNMMKFMHEYVANAEPDNQIPQIDEDSLDRDDFDFEKYLHDWTKAINQYSEHFEECQFIYVPPDKSADYKPSTNISSLRAKRVRDWIEASNKAIKDAKVKNSFLGKALSKIIFQAPPDQFFHIDDDTTDLNKIVTSNSIVVADVDGPLVSQRKVLATRESSLQSAYKKLLDTIYTEEFMIGFEKVGTYLALQSDDIGVVYQKNDGANELDLGIGAKFLQKKTFAMFWKDIFPGKATVTFRRVDRPDELKFDLNPNLFPEAMESLGYRIDFTKMVI